MKGDWVQVKYFINPTNWTTQAHSVAPLRYSRLYQVTAAVLLGGCIAKCFFDPYLGQYRCFTNFLKVLFCCDIPKNLCVHDTELVKLKNTVKI